MERNSILDFSRNERKRVKENLFGRVGLVHAKTTSKDDLEELLDSPFEWDQAVAYVYCRKCATMPEINSELAAHLALSGGFLLPESMDCMYFELASCMLCSSETTGIVLKQIE